MKVQIRTYEGNVINKEIETLVDFVGEIQKNVTEKCSFDFLGGSRLVLYSNGSYQIFGGVINYPRIFGE